jgi:hypothetical protein
VRCGDVDVAVIPAVHFVGGRGSSFGFTGKDICLHMIEKWTRSTLSACGNASLAKREKY